jgi:hypothetical protein
MFREWNGRMRRVVWRLIRPDAEEEELKLKSGIYFVLRRKGGCLTYLKIS